jgi:hypothetical protein
LLFIPRASAFSKAEIKRDGRRISCGASRKPPGNISEEEILKTVREYRSGRKKLPEITVVARTKKETA